MVEKTIAVIDMAHSGSTMLAGICEILGVPMVGPNRDKCKWEDHDLIAAFDDVAAFAALIEERNERFAIWGFKRLGAWKYEPLMKNNLINPVYLAIYKDPVSVTRRRYKSVQRNFVLKIGGTLSQMVESINGISKCGLRPHFFSYYQAVAFPEMFTLKVAEAIGVSPSESQVRLAAGWVSPNKGSVHQRYPSLEDYLVGHGLELSWTQ